MFSPQDSIASEVIRCHYVHLSLRLPLFFPLPLPLPSSLSDPMSLFGIIYHPGVASERAEISDWWLRQKQ